MVVRIGQKSARPRKTFFREWREHRGLTQEQLAERLESTKSAVSKLENGRTLYNQSSLEAWAYALNCSPQDLISRDPSVEDIRSMFEDAGSEIKNVVIKLLKAAS